MVVGLKGGKDQKKWLEEAEKNFQQEIIQKNSVAQRCPHHDGDNDRSSFQSCSG